MKETRNEGLLPGVSPHKRRPGPERSTKQGSLRLKMSLLPSFFLVPVLEWRSSIANYLNRIRVFSKSKLHKINLKPDQVTQHCPTQPVATSFAFKSKKREIFVEIWYPKVHAHDASARNIRPNGCFSGPRTDANRPTDCFSSRRLQWDAAIQKVFRSSLKFYPAYQQYEHQQRVAGADGHFQRVAAFGAGPDQRNSQADIRHRP